MFSCVTSRAVKPQGLSQSTRICVTFN